MKSLLPTGTRGKRYRHNLNSTHVTTFDMNQIKPTNIVPVLAGDTINLGYKMRCLVSPLNVPTFGSFSVRSSAFFVPMTAVWHYYEDYRKESNDPMFVTNNLLHPHKSTLYELVIKYMFDYTWDLQNFYFLAGSQDPRGMIEALAVVPSTGSGSFNAFHGGNTTFTRSDGTTYTADSTTADFIVGGVYSGTLDYHCIVLNQKGRSYINLLEGLGYTLPRFINYRDNSATPHSTISSYMLERDLSPLVAFFRCLYDYVFPSRYVNQLSVGAFFDNVNDSIFTYLDDLIDMLNVPYDSDFWTSLFVSPNSPVASTSFGSQSNVRFDYLRTNNLVGSQSQNTTSLHQTISSETSTLTSAALRWLTSASDFILRNGIGGTRFREWCRAHGLTLTREMDSSRSYLIKTFNSDVDVKQVVSTSETSSTALGDMAGKMDAQASDGFKFDAPQDGYVIFISVLIPNVGYPDGFAPWCQLPTSPKDLYLPEFSSLGYEGIANENLYSRFGMRRYDGNKFCNTTTPVPDAEGIFGYAPRYTNRYRRNKDYLTGDFAFNSRNVAYGAYHTFRDVGGYLGRNLSLVNNLDFLLSDTDYDRIFKAAPSGATNKNLYDHFFTIFFYKIEKISQVESMTDSLPLFERGDVESVDYLGNSGM